MACALDLHLVAWLAGERERAARIDCAVMCVKRLHEDFQWPYPVVKVSEPCMQRKGSTVTSEYRTLSIGGVVFNLPSKLLAEYNT